MIYEKQLTVASGKTEQAPATAGLPVSVGVITVVGWFWPRGTKGAGHLRIKHPLGTIYPSNPESSLTGNGEYQAFPTWYEVRTSGTKIGLEGWNEGSYDHTVTVRLNLLPFKVAFAEQDLLQEMRDYNELVRQLWLRPRKVKAVK